MLWVWQCTNANNIDKGKYKIYSRRHGIREMSVTYGTRFRFVLAYCTWDVSFSQHCCRRFKSSWGCVVRVVIVISKYRWELLACRCSVASHTTWIFFLSHVTTIVVSFLGAFENYEKGLSFVVCVCPFVHVELLGSHWMVEILYLSIFLKKLSRKFKFGENLTRVTGSLHEDIHTLW